MARIAVIILNWNGRKLMQDFLPSVVKFTDPEIGRVIVADNASTDDSVEWLTGQYPDVDLIRFGENHGFAGGYNRAIDQVDEEIVLLLNSDVEVTEGWLSPLLEILDRDPGVAAVQPKIKSWKEKEKFEYAGACGGYIDKWGFPFCRGRVLDVTEVDEGQYDSVAEIFWCSGAAMCIRQEIYRKAGGLDERFFAHMEEIDLCWRIRNAGWSLKVNPQSVVYHLGGGSLPMNHPRKLFLNYRNNLLMIYKNLYPALRRRVMFFRFGLDFAAAMMFLMKGEYSNTKSIFAAYREFRKLRKHYKPATIKHRDDCIFKCSIIFAFYLHGKKYFSQYLE